MGIKKRINFYELWVLCILRDNGSTPDDFKYATGRRAYQPRVSRRENDIIDCIRRGFEYKNGEGLLIINTEEAVEIYRDGVFYFLPKNKHTALLYDKIYYYDQYGNYYDVNDEQGTHNSMSDLKQLSSEEIEKKEQEQVDEKIEESKIAKEARIYKKAVDDKQNRIDHLEAILKLREQTSNIEVYDISSTPKHIGAETIPIALLSDIHIEEVVLPDSVLGLNEYNPDIAKKRLDSYFINLVKLINHHKRSYVINTAIIGLLGDVIGGYIHDELMQTNSMTPPKAISFAKSCLLSGFKYLQENLDVSRIDVICIVGNHGRITDKTQFANLTDTSYEYFLYEDLKEMCSLMGFDKFNFIIPKSGFAIINIFNKKYMFTHGNLGFSYKGGIGGLYVPFLRYFGRVAPLLGIERIFFGHYHTTIDIKEGVGNGSVKGYDAYAISKGLPYEEPKQSLVLLNEKLGFTNFQTIYLN